MIAARVRVVAATTLLCCALTACGSDEPNATDPPSSPATTTNASVSTSGAAASPSASEAAPTPESTAIPAKPPTQPISAQSRTPGGAATFLDHYIELVNWAHQATDGRAISAYVGPDCRVCRQTQANIAALASKQQHSAADLFALEAVTPPANASVSPYVVPATLVQNVTAILDTTGAEVGEFAARSTPQVYVLEWTGLGWQVTDVRAAG